MNLFNSTGKIENKEKWDPEKKKRGEEEKRRGNFQYGFRLLGKGRESYVK